MTLWKTSRTPHPHPQEKIFPDKMAEATEPSFKAFKSNEDCLLFQERRFSSPYVQQSGRFIMFSPTVYKCECQTTCPLDNSPKTTHPRSSDSGVDKKRRIIVVWRSGASCLGRIVQGASCPDKMSVWNGKSKHAGTYMYFRNLRLKVVKYDFKKKPLH